MGGGGGGGEDGGHNICTVNSAKFEVGGDQLGVGDGQCR